MFNLHSGVRLVGGSRGTGEERLLQASLPGVQRLLSTRPTPQLEAAVSRFTLLFLNRARTCLHSAMGWGNLGKCFQVSGAPYFSLRARYENKNPPIGHCKD